MRSWKFLKSLSSVMFFGNGSSVLIPWFDSSLLRDANSTVSWMRHSNSFTHEPLWVVTHINLSRQILQPIASRVVTDACQNNLAKLFSRRSPRGSFETKPCMLVNMADELQNKNSQFFRRFTIPPDPLDAQIPHPGPYLFHSVGMQE